MKKMCRNSAVVGGGVLLRGLRACDGDGWAEASFGVWVWPAKQIIGGVP